MITFPRVSGNINTSEQAVRSQTSDQTHKYHLIIYLASKDETEKEKIITAFDGDQISKHLEVRQKYCWCLEMRSQTY